jgi:hypothetical protein
VFSFVLEGFIVSIEDRDKSEGFLSFSELDLDFMEGNEIPKI